MTEAGTHKSSVEKNAHLNKKYMIFLKLWEPLARIKEDHDLLLDEVQLVLMVLCYQ